MRAELLERRRQRDASPRLSAGLRRPPARRGACPHLGRHPRTDDPGRALGRARAAQEDRRPAGREPCRPPRPLARRPQRVASRPGAAERRRTRLSGQRRWRLERRRVALLAAAGLRAGGRAAGIDGRRASVRPAALVRLPPPRGGGDGRRGCPPSGALADDRRCRPTRTSSRSRGRGRRSAEDEIRRAREASEARVPVLYPKASRSHPTRARRESSCKS